jgi:16S rRNA (cytosine1402-N4)-methyltransferase
MNQTNHEPVLLADVLEVLKPKKSEHYLDLTAGYGGHASAVLDRIGKKGSVTLVDRDQNATQYLAERFKGNEQVRIIHQDFLTASRELLAEGEHFDMILADLGVSSPHLDMAERGFSFARVGPLDMRMDTRQPVTAAEVINQWTADELTRILREYGEIRNAPRVVRAIIAKRPVETTTELATIVASVSPLKRGKRTVHPATQVFQAVRIAVNQELDLLRRSLPLWIDLLNPGGRLAVISFHSLEDRLVKQALKEESGNRYDASVQLLTTRPIIASSTEIVSNPRARSAKLRAAAKIKNRKGDANANPG